MWLFNDVRPSAAEKERSLARKAIQKERDAQEILEKKLNSQLNKLLGLKRRTRHQWFRLRLVKRKPFLPPWLEVAKGGPEVMVATRVDIDQDLYVTALIENDSDQVTFDWRWCRKVPEITEGKPPPSPGQPFEGLEDLKQQLGGPVPH